MITERDLLEAIDECNGVKNPNANTCIKLAAFYTILDHLYESEEQPPARGYSFAASPAETVKYESETEFGQEIRGKDPAHVLAIMDELMTTLKILQPRLYDGVMIKVAE